MNSCYIGSGSLLVSLKDTSGGFFTLTGESEITLKFQEDNEGIFDARNGANERVEWYVRNYRVSVEAQCFRIEPDALTLLLKGRHTVVGAVATDVPLPSGLVVGRAYLLRPNITGGSFSVLDDTAAVVSPTEYKVDEKYGLITFSAISGVEPYVVSLTSIGHEQVSLNNVNQINVEAVFRGTNRVTGQEVMAHFYRLALDISEELKLVQKPFSPLTVRLQATPDVNAPLDATLGQYGRIILL